VGFVEGAKVATRPEDQGGAAPTEDDTDQQPEAQQQPDGQAQPEDDGDPDPVEALASEMGWVPEDRYTGDKAQWKPAADFIKAGREIQRNYARDLTDLRRTVDVMSRTQADLLADRLAEQKRELTENYNNLVEEGDAASAFRVSQQLLDIDRRVSTPPPSAPTPEGQEFAERHASWFNKDQAATARAVQICNELAARGVTDPSAQLRAAERTIRLEYPEYFEGQANGTGREAPHVNRPGARSPGSSNRAKGFADMPKQAQDIANDMVARGVIKSRDDYVTRYWQNAEGKR
jgi:hypothetical protein